MRLTGRRRVGWDALWRPTTFDTPPKRWDAKARPTLRAGSMPSISRLSRSSVGDSRSWPRADSRVSGDHRRKADINIQEAQSPLIGELSENAPRPIDLNGRRYAAIGKTLSNLFQPRLGLHRGAAVKNYITNTVGRHSKNLKSIPSRFKALGDSSLDFLQVCGLRAGGETIRLSIYHRDRYGHSILVIGMSGQ